MSQPIRSCCCVLLLLLLLLLLLMLLLFVGVCWCLLVFVGVCWCMLLLLLGKFTFLTVIVWSMCLHRGRRAQS
jgi:hypothetical protein